MDRMMLIEVLDMYRDNEQSLENTLTAIDEYVRTLYNSKALHANYVLSFIDECNIWRDKNNRQNIPAKAVYVIANKAVCKAFEHNLKLPVF